MPTRFPSKSATVAVVLVPLREGFSSTSSAIRSCARCRALLTRPSRSLSLVSGPGGASSSLRSCAIAVLDAMSPRAAPPTPSQTATTCGPTYPESWLSLRTRPTSEIAEKSRRTACLLPQLEDRLADADLGAERDRGGLGDPDGADVGAVGGAEVLDEPLVAGRRDPGVPGRDVVVVELDARVAAAADEDRRVRRGRRARRRCCPRSRSHGWGCRAAWAAASWRRASPCGRRRLRARPRAPGHRTCRSGSPRSPRARRSTGWRGRRS